MEGTPQRSRRQNHYCSCLEEKEMSVLRKYTNMSIYVQPMRVRCMLEAEGYKAPAGESNGPLTCF